MTETPQPPQDRPLVTFALFAYNQERYIREAVEGAFAQTYEPLEIILSDDCSSDRTFEIMQEMAAEYEGPHDVRARRNPKNMNVAPHVLKVLREAKGDFFVLAAGDDVSDPLRTKKIIEFFQETGATGVHSGCRLIDDVGNVIAEKYIATGDLHVRYWFHVDQSSFVHGATSAYSRKVMNYFPERQYNTHGEDGLLTTAILANGLSIRCLEDKLVDYRTHAAALSNSSVTKMDYDFILAHEKKLSRAVDSYLELCAFALEAVDRSRSQNIKKQEIVSRIDRSVLRFSLRQHVYSKSFSTRLRWLIKCRSIEDFNFAVSRLFGLRFFAHAKSVRSIAPERSVDHDKKFQGL